MTSRNASLPPPPLHKPPLLFEGKGEFCITWPLPNIFFTFVEGSKYLFVTSPVSPPFQSASKKMATTADQFHFFWGRSATNCFSFLFLGKTNVWKLFFLSVSNFFVLSEDSFAIIILLCNYSLLIVVCAVVAIAAVAAAAAAVGGLSFFLVISQIETSFSCPKWFFTKCQSTG